MPNKMDKVELRACLKIPRGPAARDFGCSQGGEVGASPQRAVTVEPTLAAGKRPAARRVFVEKAGWLRCSSVTARCGDAPSSRLAIQPFPRKQDPTEFSDRLLVCRAGRIIRPARSAAARGGFTCGYRI